MNDSNSSLPSETQAWDALTRLALDLSWSWSHSADEIWKRVDPAFRQRIEEMFSAQAGLLRAEYDRSVEAADLTRLTGNRKYEEETCADF